MHHSHEALAHMLVTDPDAYALYLSRLREAVLSGASSLSSEAAERPRDLISASWSRSLSAHVNPEASGPPVVFDEEGITDLRGEHPLAACMPLLRQILLTVADEAMHVMIVTDARGHILWREGHAPVQLMADKVGLSPGTRWSEEAIGTNAMGTTLAVDRPVQVYSAEHLVSTYHAWTCAAAPVHDPDTGELLGSIDVSGPLRTIHPASVALVSAAAKLAENHLRELMSERDARLRERYTDRLERLRGQAGALLAPSGRVIATVSTPMLPATVATDAHRVRLPDGRVAELEPLPGAYLLRLPSAPMEQRTLPQLRLRVLGDAPATATIDGREVPLALRHAEILTVLALYPRGLSADQLASHLYGDHGNPITVRAEVHRLRTEIGRDVISAKPYRLNARVSVDFLDSCAAIEAGDVERVAEQYRGALLPQSEAPTIRQEREEHVACVRKCVLNCPAIEPLWRFAHQEPGRDDAEVLESLLARMGDDDARRWWVVSRLAAAENAYPAG